MLNATFLNGCLLAICDRNTPLATATRRVEAEARSSPAVHATSVTEKDSVSVLYRRCRGNSSATSVTSVRATAARRS